MLKRLLFCISVTAFLQVSADQYRYETNVGYNNTDNDIGSTNKGYSLTGVYYLTPVDSSKGPLFESSFTGRSSSIEVSYSANSQDYSPFPDSDMSHSGIAGIYTFPENGWFIGAQLHKARNDAQSLTETASYEISLGRYIASNTTIALAYHQSETDLSPVVPFFGGDQPTAVPFIGLRDPLELEDWLDFPPFRPASLVMAVQVFSKIRTENVALSLKHLGMWNDYFYSVSLGYDNINTDLTTVFSGTVTSQATSEIDTDKYGVEFALYPNRDWRFSMNYQYADQENVRTKEAGIRVNWFVTESFALDLNYFQVRSDLTIYGFLGQPLSDLDQESKLMSAGATFRF
jgi:hypothetical protein